MALIKPIFREIEKHSKTKLQASDCLLTISVGQATHEGELFDLTIKLVNDSFKMCTILVDDTLQRHTMALASNHDAAYFYERSQKAGDDWLQRNEQYYSKLSIPYKILRWDKWLNHCNFENQKIILKKRITENYHYKTTFDNTVGIFLTKYYNRLIETKGFDIARASQLSFDFLLEECTALCLWTDTQCQFEVYTGRRNQAMEETHKFFVLPNHPDLLHPLSIKFKNAKQIKPQSFDVLYSNK